MRNLFKKNNYFFFCIMAIGLLSSCASTRKIAYFNDIQDSAVIASKGSLEPIIQKKDILSITVSSLSNEATLIFNTPNLPITPNVSPNPNAPQTAGYLVGEDGNINFPVLGDIHAAGLTQKQL